MGTLCVGIPTGLTIMQIEASKKAKKSLHPGEPDGK